MDAEDRQGHWQLTYQARADREVSWTQDSPEPSLALVTAAAPLPSTSIIDIGGGASHLVDHLVQCGYGDVTVLDLSSAALAKAQTRIGDESRAVEWIVTDITSWTPGRRYEVWHDRATFHFMVGEAERCAYLARLRQALAPDGHAIIATFALDGPEKCSGLSVQRYDPASLAETLGSGFALISSTRHLHHTPWGAPQSFQFSVFKRSQAAL